MDKSRESKLGNKGGGIEALRDTERGGRFSGVEESW